MSSLGYLRLKKFSLNTYYMITNDYLSYILAGWLSVLLSLCPVRINETWTYLRNAITLAGNCCYRMPEDDAWYWWCAHMYSNVSTCSFIFIALLQIFIYFPLIWCLYSFVFISFLFFVASYRMCINMQNYLKIMISAFRFFAFFFFLTNLGVLHFTHA